MLGFLPLTESLGKMQIFFLKKSKKHPLFFKKSPCIIQDVDVLNQKTHYI
jgi:hypothetical protein